MMTAQPQATMLRCDEWIGRRAALAVRSAEQWRDAIEAAGGRGHAITARALDDYAIRHGDAALWRRVAPRSSAVYPAGYQTPAERLAADGRMPAGTLPIYHHIKAAILTPDWLVRRNTDPAERGIWLVPRRVILLWCAHQQVIAVGMGISNLAARGWLYLTGTGAAQEVGIVAPDVRPTIVDKLGRPIGIGELTS